MMTIVSTAVRTMLVRRGWAAVMVALALVLSLGGILPVLANGITFYVRPDGSDAFCDGSVDVAYSSGITNCAFATIQPAIDSADEGDIVQVANGVYVGSLVIHKGITLQGESRAGVVIQYTAGYGLNTDASNITLRSFTVQGTAGTLYGLKIEGKLASGLTPAAKNTNILIEDVATTATGRSGLDINGIDGLTIRNSSAENATSGVGFGLTDVDNAVLEGITTTGNAWGGLGIYTYGRYFPGGSQNITLSGTNQLGETQPVYLEVDNYSDPANPYPVEQFTAEGFDYTVKSIDPAFKNYTFYQPDLPAAGGFAANLPGSYMRNTVNQQLAVVSGMHIQPAIDAAGVGDIVNVYPGSYNETAPGKTLFNGSGPYQFGLFVATDKTGITVRGVDAGGLPITDYHNVLASITTNATNNFGTSGIFVEANEVTFTGLQVLPNIPGDNKTFEVIGDAFTLLDSVIDVPGGGSVYLNDWRFAEDVSYLKAYHIEGNHFAQGASLDIASGAGYSGPVSGRVIKSNFFDYDPTANWAAVSFSGKVDSIGWFVYPVSGAEIADNTFSGGIQYIRARGTYDEASFDWASYWQNNTFDKAVMVGASLPDAPRAYSYTSGSYFIDNARRIGATIQGEVDNAQPGDTVLVKAGTYPESPRLTKSVSLRSESGRDLTTIQLQHGPTYLGSLTIDSAEVTVDGFTIVGFDATASTLASSNIFLTTKPDKVSIVNNRIKVGNIDSNSNGDDGFGLITTYAVHSDAQDDVDELLVEGNLFEPLNDVGWRAFYINPGVNQFTFRQNAILGNFGGRAIAQARSGLVEENTITGSGASGGLGVWGYPTPSIYGKTIFRRNVISGTAKAISIISAENVTVENNDLHDNGIGVWVGESTNPTLSFNLATLQVSQNSITASQTYAVVNESTGGGVVNAIDNWWGSMHGPTHLSNPLGDGGLVNGAVQFAPWLCSGTDSDPVLMGFQPTAALCTNQATRLVFKTQPSDGFAGVALPGQPVVQAEGANGELAINFTDVITLILANNPGGAVLSGQTSTNAVDGVATFTNIALDKAADNYMLLALSGLLNKTSAAFNIQPYAADLAIDHSSVPTVVAPNATFSIVLTVSNAGPAPALNLVMTDSLPQGVTLVSTEGDPWTCDQLAGEVTCILPVLASGESTSLTLTLKAPFAPGNLAHQASITSDLADSLMSNNTTSKSIIVAGVPVTGIKLYIPSVQKP